MFRTPTAPTFEERLSSTHAETGAALSVFRAAARDLEAAVDKREALIEEIGTEVARLVALQDEAVQANAEDNRAASNIRDLFAA